MKRLFVLLRLAAGLATLATMMVIVGVVYNALLVDAALAGAFNLQWSNDILHIVIPIYAAVDWVLFGDRRKLPFAKLWILLVYPIVWLVVILIRGATDDWVPYPFLDPRTGYGLVAIYCIAIAGFTILFGLATFATSRARILTP